MTIRNFQHFEPPGQVSSLPDASRALERMWQALYQLRKGKLECVAELTLTPGSSNTTLNRLGLSRQSVLIFDPLTASAAAELAAGTLFVTQSNRLKDSCIITHANSAVTDRSFLVAIIG